jgi:flagellar hook-associated protein 2
VAIDSSLNLNFTQTSEARDALLSFGAAQSGGGVMISSATDRFSGVVDGLELTVNGISTEPVTVEVSENTDGLTKQIESFVEQYNKLRDRYDELTSFNADTNEVGLLFGSNVALRIDAAFTRLVSSSIRTGQSGSLRSLPEIGVRLNDRGRLTFDKEQFDRTLAANPEAVQDFFTNSINGFSKRAREVSDSLASVQSGALLARNNSIQQSIEQNTGRIASMDVRLERQRARLLQQFFGMEQAIAKLQRNLTAINQLQIIPPQTTR